MEDVLVEALVTEAPVEALDKSVLDRLSGRDVVPSDAAFFLPAHDGVRSELVAVVAKVISGFLRAATMASRSAHAVSTSARSAVMSSGRVSGLVATANYRTAPRLCISSN